ncbi:hypothetical protein EV121DRAFT_297375 [Schizophyllum commune]
MTPYPFTDPLAQLLSNAHHQSTPNALTVVYAFPDCLSPSRPCLSGHHADPTSHDVNPSLAVINANVVLVLPASTRAAGTL